MPVESKELTEWHGRERTEFRRKIREEERARYRD
jgi:hypothetical protein